MHIYIYLIFFQGTLEFVKGNKLVANQNYDVFGHGGMVFWMSTSAFFFFVSFHFMFYTKVKIRLDIRAQLFKANDVVS